MQTILIAEDEQNIADILTAYLSRDGFVVKAVSDGAEALAFATKNTVDLMLLDVMLPGMMGFDVLAKLRNQSRLPVIMLTSKASEQDRLQGFELGADDYICKPFSPREVVARIKSVLRRTRVDNEPAAKNETAPDRFALQDDTYSAMLGDLTLSFTPSEFRLLKLLAHRPNRIFSREELLDDLTGHFSDCSYRAIDSHIKNLRRKLSNAAPHLTIIQSVYGVGYKFNTPFVARAS